jgi:hypothetical protein
LAKNSSFGFFGLGFRVGKKPKVLFVRLVSLLSRVEPDCSSHIRYTNIIKQSAPPSSNRA